jgi:hypothetical protein
LKIHEKWEMQAESGNPAPQTRNGRSAVDGAGRVTKYSRCSSAVREYTVWQVFMTANDETRDGYLPTSIA